MIAYDDLPEDPKGAFLLCDICGEPMRLVREQVTYKEVDA